MERPDRGKLLSDLTRGLSRALVASAPERLGDAEAVARKVLEGDGLPHEVERLFAGRPMASLVSFDADRIQSWVFASERVPVAKGASLTLDDLNRRVPAMVGQVAGVHGVVYSAGGGGMLFGTGADDLTPIEEGVRGWLERQSRELTFTVTSLPLYAADLRPSTGAVQLTAAGHGGLHRFEIVDGVQGALVRLQVRVRQMKDARPREGGAPPQLRARTGSAADRCPSCWRRPPSKPPGVDDGPDTWCGWCRGLYRASRDLSDAPEGRPEGEPALTFSELAEASNRGRRYLAFAAIDGNGMGAIVQSLGTFLELAAFSHATSEIFERARRSIRSVLGRGFLQPDWDTARASLSLLSGGDEVTFVLPSAPAPLAVLEALGEIEAGFNAACDSGGLLHAAFGSARKAVLDRLRRCGAAAGLVLAHPHYPVRLLRLYANELQKQAKRSEARSSVAWRLLTDSSPLVDESAAAEQPPADLALDAFAGLLHETESAIRVNLPVSALRGVVDQVRYEDESLASLPATERERALPLLAANFFRYQLARSEPLRAWWTERSRSDGESRPPEEDDVAQWFAAGGTRHLSQVLELLALEPDARVGGRKAS